MGALHDFALVVARLQQPKVKSSLGTLRGRYGGNSAPQLPHAEPAEDRWYGEGGNTQTRLARRAQDVNQREAGSGSA